MLDIYILYSRIISRMNIAACTPEARSMAVPVRLELPLPRHHLVMVLRIPNEHIIFVYICWIFHWIYLT